MGRLIHLPFGLGELYMVWRYGQRAPLDCWRSAGGSGDAWTFTWGPVEVVFGS